MRMFCSQRRNMLVQTCSVKIRETMRILWKMSRNPIYYHSNAVIMHYIYKFHELLRRAVPRCESEITRNLITPRVVKRVFRNGKKLNMSKAHIFRVLRQLLSNLRNIDKLIPFFGTPRAYMQLVNINGRSKYIS